MHYAENDELKGIVTWKLLRFFHDSRSTQLLLGIRSYIYAYVHTDTYIQVLHACLQVDLKKVSETILLHEAAAEEKKDKR